MNYPKHPYRARLHDIAAQLHPHDTLVNAVWKMRETKQAIIDVLAKQEMLRFKRSTYDSKGVQK